jgi:O-acetylserine/cysteine efflux transporter
MSGRHALMATAVAMIWGVNFVVIDEGLAGVPPLLFVAIRFTIVTVPAIFLVPRPAAPFREIAVVGVLMCAGQFGLLYVALEVGMSPGLAALVLQTQVLLTAVIAGLRLHERPTSRQAVGLTLGAVGLLVVCSDRSTGASAVGLALTFAAALSWAMGNVAARRVGASSGLSMTVWSATVVPLPIFVLSLLLEGPASISHSLSHFPVSAVLSTAYTAYLSSLVGYGIWNSLLASYPAASVTVFALLVPPVGILAAWLLQGETPGLLEILGGAILLTGVLCTLGGPRPPRERRARHHMGAAPAYPYATRADGDVRERSRPAR